MLYEKDLAMSAKAFAVGYRMEHPQTMINYARYGVDLHEKLEAADYKVTYNTDTHGIYSFCMCPGGYVVNASSEEGRLAVNGMSYSDRSGINSNSAIVVTVTPEDTEIRIRWREWNSRGKSKQRHIRKVRGKYRCSALGISVRTV